MFQFMCMIMHVTCPTHKVHAGAKHLQQLDVNRGVVGLEATTSDEHFEALTHSNKLTCPRTKNVASHMSDISTHN